MSDGSSGGLLKAIPLFPLPNVVLFPHTVLPLHVFEHRYLEMTRDALDGARQIAMALLKPGWEKNYYGRPKIDPVVCVGEIVAHEQMPDGKYNFLLRGHTRARIVREVGRKLYRCANLAPLTETTVPEIELGEERQQLVRLFNLPGLNRTTIGGQIASLFKEGVPTSVIADVIAFHYLDDLVVKQDLLAECDVRLRIAKVVVEMEVFCRKQSAPQIPFDPSVN